MTEVRSHDPSVLRCLVEEGAGLRSTRQRQFSVVASIAMQAAVLGTTLLVPLLVNGEKLRATIFVAPIPPYQRVPQPTQKPTSRGTPVKPPGTQKPLGIYQPPVIPEHVAEIHEPPALPEVSALPGTSIPGAIPGEPGAGPPNMAISNPPAAPKPQAPEPQPRPFMRSEFMEGRLILRVQPQYPPPAKQIRLQGTVHLRAVIGRDGTVRELEILDGPPLLALAAVQAVQQWRYQPAVLNGQPVEVETRIIVHFRLQ